jgi:hypothetical protein
VFSLFDVMCLLPAILRPGGSSTVHIYTQTIHRTTQLTTRPTHLTTEQHIKIRRHPTTVVTFAVRHSILLRSYWLLFKFLD